MKWLRILKRNSNNKLIIMSVGYNSRRVFTLVINLFIISVLFGQQTTINYISSSSIIANPERGWYDDYYSHTGGSNLSVNYRPLSAKELIENRENDKITLIMRLFYLHEFLDQTDVSTEYLSKMQADFDSIRAQLSMAALESGFTHLSHAA